MSERFEDLELLVTDGAVGAQVSVSGDIDLASVEALRDALDTLFERATGDLDVDLSRTEFCDSIGLCTLLAARRQFDAAGRTMRLLDPSPCVSRLLELTATSELFEITTGRPSTDLDPDGRPDPPA